MRELIYYPSFEFSNINWIKFALLYIKQLDSIVPVSGDKHLSDFFNKIRNETDLIKLHRPKYLNESYPASLDAMEQIEKILENPNRYRPTFNKINIVDMWKQRQHQNHILYEGKYTNEFGRYCIDNNIAHECNERNREWWMLAAHLSIFLKPDQGTFPYL
ncbi:MAG: hypothetical protein ACOCG5_01045 [Candidatus Alkaliphilus sp. MAG34]